MKLLSFLIICIVSCGAFAQGQEIPKAAVEALAKDLAQMHEAVLEAQRKQQAHDLTGSKSPWFGADQITVTNPSTVVRTGANQRAGMLLTVKKNQTFPVIDRAGDWYAVALPEKTQGLSTGWVAATDVVPTLRTPSGNLAAEGIFNDLTERAVRLKETYQKNPYFSITGFAVNVGVPPSVSINFEFKK